MSGKDLIAALTDGNTDAPVVVLLPDNTEHAVTAVYIGDDDSVVILLDKQ